VRLILHKTIRFIDHWHWVWLILASPLFAFPSPIRSPALLVVPILWTIGWVVRPKAALPSTPLNGVIVVLMGMVFVSTLVTPDLDFSLPKIAGMVFAVGIFYAVAREAKHPTGLCVSLMLFLFAGVGVAVLGLLGTNWLSKFSVFSTITGYFSTHLKGLPGAEDGFHSNEVAGALLWVIPVFAGALVGLMTIHTRKDRTSSAWIMPIYHGSAIFRLCALTLLTLGTLLCLGVLLLTQSRGSYLALSLTILMTVFIVLFSKWPKTTAFLVICVALFIAIAVSRVNIQDVITQFSSTKNSGADSANVINSIDGRLEVWSRAIYGISDFPITGMGMNSFRRVVPVLYPMFLVSPDFDIAHAHNEFLQAALDLGIPGMIAFGALYLVALWMLRRIWVASAGDGLTRALVLGLGGGLFVHLIYGMTDAVALGAKPGVLFWMLLGLICGLFAQRCATHATSIPTT